MKTSDMAIYGRENYSHESLDSINDTSIYLTTSVFDPKSSPSYIAWNDIHKELRHNSEKLSEEDEGFDLSPDSPYRSAYVSLRTSEVKSKDVFEQNRDYGSYSDDFNPRNKSGIYKFERSMPTFTGLRTSILGYIPKLSLRRKETKENENIPETKNEKTNLSQKRLSQSQIHLESKFWFGKENYNIFQRTQDTGQWTIDTVPFFINIIKIRGF